MAAYLHPPRSGEYTFWIASDDSSDLRLSTDEDPTRVRKIAFVMEGFWTNPHEWDRFPVQRSEPVYLQSDKSYYIEAYQEQALQDDHLSVAWEGPGIARSVIPGMYLTPWAGTARTARMDGNGGDQTNGVLREYWTNYTAGSVTPVIPAGPAGAASVSRDASFQVIGAGTRPEPRTVDLRQPLLPENNFRWIQTEGILTFVSADGPSATLELAAGPRRVSVHVAQWNQPRLQAGQNSHVRVEGVCEGVNDANGVLATGFIWVPASEDVRLLEAVSDQEESIVPSSSPTNSIGSFGGYYVARGAVTFDGSFSGRRYLYVQDIQGSVLVSDADRVLRTSLEVGQRVQVGGALSAGKVGFQLVPITLRLLGWQCLPLPASAGGDSEYRDGQWTEVEGVVRSIRADGVLSVMGAGGPVWVWSPLIPVDNSLVDCAVRLRGVISLGTEDAPLLLVGSRQFVEIEEQGPKDPFSLPLSQISDLDSLRPSGPRVHRVKVAGTITYANEATVFLQDNSGPVRLQLRQAPSVHPGDRFEAVGFPEARGSVRLLAEPDLHATGIGPEVEPCELDLHEALAKNHNGTLVQVRGNLLAETHRGPDQVLALQSGQRVFEAVLPSNNGRLPPLTPGSLLNVTGVCITDLIPGPNTKPANWETPSLASLQILLRAPTDITVQRGPPWWTPMKGVALVGFLLTVLGATLLWIRLQGRRYERRQSAQLEFSRQILKSQETERHRIAANLHDSLGQNLLVIKNQARLAMQPDLDRPGVFERLNEISGMASQVIEEVRQITHDLRPSELDRLGLSQTLRGTIRRVSESCPTSFASHVDEIDGLFDSDDEIHIYRILQEGLSNVVKHSGATEATALVRKEGDSLLIIVRDNGRGLASGNGNGAELPHAGLGLSGINERAKILRGKATFGSDLGRGFRLTVEIPLPAKHDTR
jgi:signal transduction histidine kinase